MIHININDIALIKLDKICITSVMQQLKINKKKLGITKKLEYTVNNWIKSFKGDPERYRNYGIKYTNSSTSNVVRANRLGLEAYLLYVLGEDLYSTCTIKDIEDMTNHEFINEWDIEERETRTRINYISTYIATDKLTKKRKRGLGAEIYNVMVMNQDPVKVATLLIKAVTLKAKKESEPTLKTEILDRLRYFLMAAKKHAHKYHRADHDKHLLQWLTILNSLEVMRFTTRAYK